MARLDQLGPAKGTAQLGATMGREFPAALLQAVTPLDEDVLRQDLQHLVEAELLYQRGVGATAVYQFKHALIQETAYASLLRRTRQHYHQHIAQVLEAQFPDTMVTQPELLAHHYTEASRTEQAIPYWQRAGQQASDRSANQEAISHFTTGIALLKTLPETPEHTQRAITLHLALGSALRMTKGAAAPEVEHAYTQVHALCQQVGETPELFQPCWGCGSFILDGYSCPLRESSGKRYCAWRNVLMTLCSLSPLTLPLGGRCSTLAHCVLPACTWRKPLYSIRQTSAVLRCFA